MVFLCSGIFFIHPGNIGWPGWPGAKPLGDSVILLLFAFVGIEVALIPSGEVKNPARTVPRSIYLALVTTTIIYLLIQLVAQGTLGPELANDKDAPLAESAARFLGNFGRTLLLTGATLSAFGFVTSDILSSPRMIFAFGRDGSLPSWFAHVHRRYRTPDFAILTYTGVAFALSVFGSFESMAVLSNVAILLMYLVCCAATWFLVHRDVRADGPPFDFSGAKVVPVLAIGAIIWILTEASLSQSSVGNDTRAGLRIAAIVLVIASVVYIVVRWLKRT
jgi:amino acid transporter